MKGGKLLATGSSGTCIFRPNIPCKGDSDKVTNDNSVYCFVEKETGNVYKPAGWRAPYTKGNNPVRGNIFNVSSYENADPYGGWLYCR